MQVNKGIFFGLLCFLNFVGDSVAEVDDIGAFPEELSDEFLEYLGEYENIDGEWIDPYEFAEVLEEMANLGKVAARATGQEEVADEKHQ